MQSIRVEDAVGAVLCHDITKIVPGGFKGPAFKKGHVINEADIPELLKLGKEHIFVWEAHDSQVHEDEAAIRLANAVKGQGISLTEPKEGKVNLLADYDGMSLINEGLLIEINMIEEIAVATRNNRRPVKKGDVIAGVRVIPLLIEEQKLQLIERMGRNNEIAAVRPFRPLKAGIVTTGSEVFHNRIEDRFSPVVKAKIESYGCEVIKQLVVPDNPVEITRAIDWLINRGAELVLTTGGMSIDPDDVTPAAIRATGADIVSYGAPVLPGAMMMVAYLGNIPILGLPGCVMYHKTTVFDLIIPSVLSGEKISKGMLARLGLGGLCLYCDVCRYPDCSFGTGA
ncbi:molybdopterin-binding protein [Syntrophomonas curvata]